MLTSLIGTPWLPSIRDGILVVEDINEHPFRVERMLLQLLHSGVLAAQKAVIFGSFTGSAPNDYDAGTICRRSLITCASSFPCR